MSNYDDPKRSQPVDYVEEPLVYKEDPDRIRRLSTDYDKSGSRAVWIAGAVALAVALAVGAYAIGTKTTNVAETKPTLTETRTTTGSGTTSPPATQQKQ
jgi:hypothetical protein